VEYVRATSAIVKRSTKTNTAPRIRYVIDHILRKEMYFRGLCSVPRWVQVFTLDNHCVLSQALRQCLRWIVIAYRKRYGSACVELLLFSAASACVGQSLRSAASAMPLFALDCHCVLKRDLRQCFRWIVIAYCRKRYVIVCVGLSLRSYANATFKVCVLRQALCQTVWSRKLLPRRVATRTP
jgi:hypothetical protein